MFHYGNNFIINITVCFKIQFVCYSQAPLLCVDNHKKFALDSHERVGKDRPMNTKSAPSAHAHRGEVDGRGQN